MPTTRDVSAAVWRKSSYSNNDGGNCVEVADNFPGGVVPVRDSKNPDGPAIPFPTKSWVAFIASLKA
ncbi:MULTISPECIES: DUF397 domain-containing protein [Streptomyces]|uniref:DUF397 domain-containing protein n=2 Tax=Streptomyces malaysiensis TaxID=92644 RepID=A0A2J7YUY8_STRMQ|nr:MULTISPECIES: DUF397 domain-containing protein [Streptomyces]PNG91847.1 hypothetical protein SMF913_27312 [Streptomyces malaysiensis]QPI59469.1 DUF397 domain-containing protein [Streptomyces solisilvae]UHH21122.1 DUF397 domain-containing protein [Streptomyces sp. HNM0561]